MIATSLALLVSQALAAPTPPERLERKVLAMGTELSVSIEARSREEALAASSRAIEAVQTAEKRLSTWREDSELAALNRAKAGSEIPLSPELERDLSAAFACAKGTAGAFDPAIGPLLAAWDTRGQGRVPTPTEIERAKKDSDASHFELKAGLLIKRSASARIEEGGFGKGAGLDDAARALKSSGTRTALLDFGGQVFVIGNDREISIASPMKRDQVLLTLTASEGSVSTSGNSERGHVVSGRKVGHIMDPKSGRPATFQGSVTAIAPTGLEADCLSTGLFVMGPGPGLAYVRERGERFGAVFVSPSKRGSWLVQASCGLKGRLKAAAQPVRIVFDCPTDAQGEAP